MKIIYKSGDLFTCSESYIAHGCNCMGVMGKGIAKTVKELYPYAYDQYMIKYKESGLYPGDMIIAEGNLLQPTVFNCLTQYFYGNDKNIRYISYNALRMSMRKINMFLAINDNKPEVAMPKIGCNFGNGNWDIISKIIEEESTYFQPIVYVKD